jgi:hypothetical protein
MKYEYVVKMGSSAMIYLYVSNFKKIGSTIQKLIGEHTDSREIT